MIDKFVNLVNETVDESFARGIELFMESLEDDVMMMHKIVNEGLDTVLEQACTDPDSDDEEEVSEIDQDLDSLSVEEIAEAMEEVTSTDDINDDNDEEETQ